MSRPEYSAFALLTRPEGKNERLAARLDSAGIGNLIMPALKVEALPVDCVELPLPDLYDLVVFVSGHAVRFYLDSLEHCGYPASWPVSTQVATVGVASAQALQQSGRFDAMTVLCPPSSQLQDSESLWRILRPHIARFGQVLIVRGQTGREWLGQKLEAAQARVSRYAAYHRQAAVWAPAQVDTLARRLTVAEPLLVVLTSTESMEAFFQNARQHHMQQHLKDAHYIVIHDRLAAGLHAMLESFSGKVDAARISISSPSDDAIFDAIISLVSPLKRR